MQISSCARIRILCFTAEDHGLGNDFSLHEQYLAIELQQYCRNSGTSIPCSDFTVFLGVVALGLSRSFWMSLCIEEPNACHCVICIIILTQRIHFCPYTTIAACEYPLLSLHTTIGLFLFIVSHLAYVHPKIQNSTTVGQIGDTCPLQRPRTATASYNASEPLDVACRGPRPVDVVVVGPDRWMWLLRIWATTASHNGPPPIVAVHLDCGNAPISLQRKFDVFLIATWFKSLA